MRKHHRLPTVDPSPRRLTPQNFEIRPWSFAVPVAVAIAATGTSAMAVTGVKPASIFQNAVTILLLESGQAFVYTGTRYAGGCSK